MKSEFKKSLGHVAVWKRDEVRETSTLIVDEEVILKSAKLTPVACFMRRLEEGEVDLLVQLA
jgi:hypothetical protein